MNFFIFFIIISISSTNFQSILNGALNHIKNEGTWEIIVDKYIYGMSTPTDTCNEYPKSSSITGLKKHYLVGTDHYYPYYIPANITANRTSISGITVEILDVMFENINNHYDFFGEEKFTYEYVMIRPDFAFGVELNWFDYVMAKLNNDSIDFHDCTDITPSRIKHGSFSCAYATSSHGMLKRKGFSKSILEDINVPETTIIMPSGYSINDVGYSVFDRATITEIPVNEKTVRDFVDEINEQKYDILLYPYAPMAILDLESICEECKLSKIDDLTFQMNTDDLTGFVFKCEGSCIETVDNSGVVAGIVLGVIFGCVFVIILVIVCSIVVLFFCSKFRMQKKKLAKFDQIDSLLADEKEGGDDNFAALRINTSLFEINFDDIMIKKKIGLNDIMITK